jgi:gliding motility-associated-like protein
MKKLFFLVSLLCCLSSTAQDFATHLYFSANNDVIKLQTDGLTSQQTIISLPMITQFAQGVATEGQAFVEDAAGNLLFYVIYGGVFRADNSLMPGSAGMFFFDSESELIVCPFPGDPEKFYIFHNDLGCSNLRYAIVDMSLAGGTGDVSVINQVLHPNDFGEGKELVPIPGTPNYQLLTYQCEVGLTVFEINQNGIGPPVLLQAYSGDPFNQAPAAWAKGCRELDVNQGKGVMALSVENKVVIFDYDPLANTLTNFQQLNLFPPSFTNPYGVEFSSDLSKLYVSSEFNSVMNLARLNLASMQLTYASVNGGGSLGQIGIGLDEKMYISCYNQNTIAVIDDPNASSPTIGLSFISTQSTFFLGVSYPIRIPPSPIEISSFSSPATCLSSKDGQASVSVLSGGVPPFSYLWSDEASQTDSMAVNLSEGTYYVTVTDLLGNSVVDTVYISALNNYQLQLTAEVKAPSCVGMSDGSLEVSVSAGSPPYQFDWNGHDPQALPAGSYAYLVTDSIGCSQLDSADLPFPIPLTASLEVLSNDCSAQRSAVALAVSGGSQPYAIDWQGHDSTAVPVGSHEVVIIDSKGCDILVPYTITAPSFPIADFELSTHRQSIYSPWVDVQSTSTEPTGGALAHYWSIGGLSLYEGETSFTHTFTSAGEHELLHYVENEWGCVDTAKALFEVYDEHRVFLPDAFTPNKNGLNERFKPHYHYVDEATYSLQIYDRWGGLLYNSKDIDDGWDGLHPESGELVPTGVYAYVVKARSKSGRYILEAGEVHLLH